VPAQRRRRATARGYGVDGEEDGRVTEQRAAGAVDPGELERRLAEQGYLADRGLATVVTLAMRLGKPLLLEGDAGVGKTELAKALAQVLGARLIRLQCYEGIDVAHAVYDWNYSRQMLYLRALDARGADQRDVVDDLFGRDFLVRRPLLDAIDNRDPVPPVLLIDEIDRADDEFEAFLLELLSDFQITIPEIGTIAAEQAPVVVLTSNRTRELHDALKRRCVYHWLDHPSIQREVEIIRLRVPQARDELARTAAEAVARLRELDLVKPPGVAETVDWTQAVVSLGGGRLDPAGFEATAGTLLKHREDIDAAARFGYDRLLSDGDERDGVAD
jgi:MoxR-like ATPase